MSWMPAARESRVGARLPVMRERREATADGGIGGRGVEVVFVVDDDEGSGSRASSAVASREARILCWEGSRRDGSILMSVSDDLGVGAESGCDGSSGLCIGGLIRGMDVGRRSAFMECRSR